MITMLKIFLGCKGTWFWACRKMNQGQVVYRLRDSGVVYFTYDKGRRKIKAMIDWGGAEQDTEWGISMEDVFAIDFMLLTERTNYGEIHRQSQMKCDSRSLKASQLKKHLNPIEPLKEGPTKSQIKNHVPGEIYIGPAPKPIKPEFPKDRIQKHYL